jgi:hypothetical protein
MKNFKTIAMLALLVLVSQCFACSRDRGAAEIKNGELTDLLTSGTSDLSANTPWKTQPFKFGVNADNWNNEIELPGFAQLLKDMGVEFVIWHLSPEEETSDGITRIVEFCRKHQLEYLFNTELVNYVPGVPYFQNADGTYRWDLRRETLEMLKDDPLFLGQVYDEPMLMQSLRGETVQGRTIPPYFVDTSGMEPEKAFLAVAGKIRELQAYFASYGKDAVFEMVFPDYAHCVARGGGILTPKLLKENPNDLMFAVYAGAARQYQAHALWACVDLWFLDNFPKNGVTGEKFHTPEELYAALCYAYSQGFDRAYVEHIKGLVNLETDKLTDFGRKVVEFQKNRKALPRTNWREYSPELVVKRFPDGYWGQRYSTFIPDHPYGTYTTPELQAAGDRWLKLLADKTGGKLPKDANNWNAILHPYFQNTAYFLFAGLPPMLVADHLCDETTTFPSAHVENLTSQP